MITWNVRARNGLIIASDLLRIAGDIPHVDDSCCRNRKDMCGRNGLQIFPGNAILTNVVASDKWKSVATDSFGFVSRAIEFGQLTNDRH